MGGGLNSPSQVGQCGIPIIEDVSAVRCGAVRGGAVRCVAVRGWGCGGVWL